MSSRLASASTAAICRASGPACGSKPRPGASPFSGSRTVGTPSSRGVGVKFRCASPAPVPRLGGPFDVLGLGRPLAVDHEASVRLCRDGADRRRAAFGRHVSDDGVAVDPVDRAEPAVSEVRWWSAAERSRVMLAPRSPPGKAHPRCSPWRSAGPRAARPVLGPTGRGRRGPRAAGAPLAAGSRGRAAIPCAHRPRWAPPSDRAGRTRFPHGPQGLASGRHPHGVLHPPKLGRVRRRLRPSEHGPGGIRRGGSSARRSPPRLRSAPRLRSPAAMERRDATASAARGRDQSPNAAM